MTYYLCLSKIGPATAFTTRDDAERFKVSRLSNEHAEVVEVVSADEINQLKQQLAQAQAACVEVHRILNSEGSYRQIYEQLCTLIFFEEPKLSGWSPDKSKSLQKELQDEKKYSESLAADICKMEDALGFSQDQHDKDGAFVPTIGPWLERVRDLIAAEGELGDLRADLHEAAELLRVDWVYYTLSMGDSIRRHKWTERRDAFLAKISTVAPETKTTKER